jgi:hypothetical protein
MAADFNMPSRIINQAMHNAGLLAEGSIPNTTQYTDMMNRLNDLINYWQTQGLKLWLQTDQAIALVAGQASYTMKLGGNVNITKPMRILQAYYIDTSSNKRPLDPPLSREEYTRLSNVIQQGAINSYFIDKQQTQLVVYLWQVPDVIAATGAVHVIIQQQVTNIVTINDTMNFPQEWYVALCWGLADEICTGQPQAIMDRCEKKSAMLFDALQNWDVEDAATSFQPSSRGASSAFV